MLETLDQVAWDQLTHAYGPATDVPGLLRALVDPEVATKKVRVTAEKSRRTLREQVIWELWGNVFHQGTVWEVTPHVVPFFEEIVREGPREVRAFAIRYMHHLALGYPEDLFPVIVEPVEYFRLAEEPDGKPDDPFSAWKMCRYARDCYRAVEAALPTIAACASDADDHIALAAIAALGSFRTAAPMLRELAAASTARRLATALVALAQLDPERALALARPLLDDADREAALLAAVADVLAGGVDDAAIRILVAPLEDLVEHRNPLAGTLGTLVSRTLGRVPEPHLDTVIGAIAASLATAAPSTNLSVTGVLLRLAFGSARAPATAGALTPRQRTAVAAIAAHGAFELGGYKFGNYAELLSNRGLPDDAQALGAWLAR